MFVSPLGQPVLHSETRTPTWQPVRSAGAAARLASSR